MTPWPRSAPETWSLSSRDPTLPWPSPRWTQGRAPAKLPRLIRGTGDYGERRGRLLDEPLGPHPLLGHRTWLLPIHADLLVEGRERLGGGRVGDRLEQRLQTRVPLGDVASYGERRVVDREELLVVLNDVQLQRRHPSVCGEHLTEVARPALAQLGVDHRSVQQVLGAAGEAEAVGLLHAWKTVVPALELALDAHRGRSRVLLCE